MRPLFALIPVVLVGCAHQTPAAAAGNGADTATLTPAAERPTFTGNAENFTGEAQITMLFMPAGARTFSGAEVTFQPGARTAWHSHPAGQTLVVTDGGGWVQLEGQPRQDIAPGDVFWTPPGVRHWHGATDTTAMTHLALQGATGDGVVDWQEHVTDAQYLGTP